MSLIRSVRLEATVATRRNPAHPVSYYDQALIAALYAMAENYKGNP